MATGVDTRIWNLGVPLGLLAVGCGRTTLVAEGSDSVGESAPTSVTTTPGGCDPACPPGYECIDGVCQYYGCLDFCCYEYDPCCYDPCCGDPCCGDPCCYDDGGYCGYCSSHADCPPGEFCTQYGSCSYAAVLPECGVGPGLYALPLPGVDGAAVSLAFMDINADPALELLISTATDVTAVVGPDAAVTVPVPFGQGGALAVGDIDGDGDDDVVLANESSVMSVTGEPGVGLEPVSSYPAPTPVAAVVFSDVDGDFAPELVLVGSPLRSGYAEQWQLDVGGIGFADPILLDSALDASMLAAGRYGAGPDGFVLAHQSWVLVSRFSPFGQTSFLWDGFRFGELTGIAAPDFFGDTTDDAVSAGAIGGWTLWTLMPDANSWWSTYKLAGELRLVAAGELGDGPAEDLVFGDADRIVIVHGDPGGGFCTTEHLAPHAVVLAAVGDFTGDGLADVAISDGAQTTIMVRAP